MSLNSKAQHQNIGFLIFVFIRYKFHNFSENAWSLEETSSYPSLRNSALEDEASTPQGPSGMRLPPNLQP